MEWDPAPCQGGSHTFITSSMLWLLLQTELKFWKVPLLGAAEEGSEARPGVNLLPFTSWVEPTFNGIYSRWVALMSLLHSTCSIWHQHPCANPQFWGETLYPNDVYTLILLSLYMIYQQLHRGETWVFQMSLKLQWTFPIPSVVVLEENLSYPDIIQGIPRLVVTGQKRFSHNEDQI